MSRPVPSPALPPLFDTWMREHLGRSVGSEPLATCHDCAMCGNTPGRPPLPVAGGPMVFDPDAKCCTYEPELWNFLVGLALADDSPQAVPGRGGLVDRLRTAESVTPLGIGRSRRYDTLYRRGAEGFGLAHTMRCPHFLESDGRCGVWRYRESTCATWFCKHEQGAMGKRFWDRLHDALHTAEVALARHAALQLDLGSDAVAALFPIRREEGRAAERSLTAADLDGHRDPARHRRIWGHWFGREEEFFVASGRLVSDLAWPDVRAVGGAELAMRLALLDEADRARLDRALPPRLAAQSVSVVPGGAEAPDHVQLVTYSGYDPLEVPEVIVRALPYFDGRPVAQALDAIESALGVRLERGLVVRLHQFGVLAPAARPVSPSR